jgi:hypothetical protein
MKTQRHEDPASTAEAVVLAFIYTALVAGYILLGILFR